MYGSPCMAKKTTIFTSWTKVYPQGESVLDVNQLFLSRVSAIAFAQKE